MLAVLVLALVVLCVRGDWDPDDPPNCKYMRIGYWPYAVDTCMGFDLETEGKGSEQYTCDGNGDILYEFWENEECSGEPQYSESISDYLIYLNSYYRNYSDFNCDGEDCSVLYREYKMEDYSDPNCRDEGYFDDSVATDVCTTYYGYGYVFECSDDTLTVNIYSNDNECRNAWYHYEIEDGCHGFNDTSYYWKYDLTCGAPSYTIALLCALVLSSFLAL